MNGTKIVRNNGEVESADCAAETAGRCRVKERCVTEKKMVWRPGREDGIKRESKGDVVQLYTLLDLTQERFNGFALDKYKP